MRVEVVEHRGSGRLDLERRSGLVKAAVEARPSGGNRLEDDEDDVRRPWCRSRTDAQSGGCAAQNRRGQGRRLDSDGSEVGEVLLGKAVRHPDDTVAAD